MEQKRKIVFLLLLPPRPSWTKVFGDQVGLFIQQLFFATEGLPTYLPTLQENEQTSKRYVIPISLSFYKYMTKQFSILHKFYDNLKQ